MLGKKNASDENKYVTTICQYYSVNVAPNGWGDIYTLGGLQAKVGENGTWASVGADGTVLLTAAPTHFQYTTHTLQDGILEANITAPEFSGTLTAPAEGQTAYTGTLTPKNTVTYTLVVKAYAESGTPGVNTNAGVTIPSPTQNGNDYTYTIVTNKTSADIPVKVTVHGTEKTATLKAGTPGELTFDAVQLNDYTITSNVDAWWNTETNGKVSKLEVSSDGNNWVTVNNGVARMKDAPKQYRYDYTLGSTYAAQAGNITVANTGTWAADAASYTATLANPGIKTYKLKVTAYDGSDDPTLTWSAMTTIPQPTANGNVYEYTIYTNKVSGDQNVSVSVGSDSQNVTLTEGADATNAVAFEKPVIVKNIIFVKAIGENINDKLDNDTKKLCLYFWNCADITNPGWPGIAGELHTSGTYAGFYAFDLGKEYTMHGNNVEYKFTNKYQKNGNENKVNPFECGNFQTPLLQTGKAYIVDIDKKEIKEYDPNAPGKWTLVVNTWSKDNPTIRFQKAGDASNVEAFVATGEPTDEPKIQANGDKNAYSYRQLTYVFNANDYNLGAQARITVNGNEEICPVANGETTTYWMPDAPKQSLDFYVKVKGDNADVLKDNNYACAHGANSVIYGNGTRLLTGNDIIIAQGTKQTLADGQEWWKFELKDATTGNFPLKTDKIVFRPNSGNWDNQVTDLSVEIEQGGYYELEVKNSHPAGRTDHWDGAITKVNAPVANETYTVKVTTNGWDTYADLGAPKVKCGDKEYDAVAKDGAADTYTVTAPQGSTPAEFKFTTAKVKADYIAAFIDLTNATKAVTLASNEGTLAAHNIGDKTLNVTTFKDGIPTVTVAGQKLATPETEATDYKYSFTIKTNKADTDLTGTVAVANSTDQAIDWTNGNTFADPYTVYTYYLDVTEPVMHSKENANDSGSTTNRAEWRKPVLQYNVAKSTDANKPNDVVLTNAKKVEMTEIADGSGVYKAEFRELAANVGGIIFSRSGTDDLNTKCQGRTNILKVADLVCGHLYSLTKANDSAWFYDVADANNNEVFTPGTASEYTIKVQVPATETNKPYLRLYKGQKELCAPAQPEAEDVEGSKPARKQYTYVYRSCLITDGITAKPEFNNKELSQDVAAGKTVEIYFPTLTTEYRLCGDAFGGWGTQTVDGVQQPTDGGMVMTKNATTNAYEVTVEKAEGFDNKNFVIAYYTLEDGVAKTRTPLCVSAAQDVNIDGDVTLSMTATAAEGQELKTPFMHAKANATAKFTFTPAAGKTDQGELKIDMTADYAVTPKANGTEKFYDLSGLQYQLTKGGNWVDATNGSTSKTKRPVAYQYATKAAKAVSADYSADLAAIATANAGNIAASGDLNYDGKGNVTTTMAKPLVYTLKMNSAYGAPTEVTFKVDNQPYENFFNPNGAAAAKSAPARAAVDNKVYTYTLITDKHAETSTAAVSMKVKGYSLTVTDIAAATDLSNPAAATESSATVYTLHDELNICGPSGIAGGKLFPGDWDEKATATNNVFMTRDNITYTFTAKNVPASTEKYTAGFGLRMKDFTNGKLTWLQGSKEAYKLAPGTPVKTYAENGDTYKNMELDFKLDTESDVTFVYVCDRGAATGTLSVYVGEFTPVIRGSKDFVGGLDFSKATIEVTKKDGNKVTIAGDAQGVQGLKFDDIESAKFTEGVVVSDIDGNVVTDAIKNFVYATDLNVTVDQTPDANGLATPVKDEWAATVTKGENGTLVFHANRTKGAQYYSFVYHDWCVDKMAPKLVEVEVKLADGTTTKLKAWHTKTPKLFEGELNGTAPVNDNPGAELTANGGQNYDKSYGMVATPPKDAPGTDYWFMVMTDLPGVDFLNAVATVYPDREAKTGAIPVYMTFDELPAERVIKHYMNSQFRIYRVGAEVDWRLDQATEYVSNTGLFYVDGLKACTKTTEIEATAGQGYKFSTIDPRKDYKNGAPEEWNNFNKGIFGYCEYSTIEHQHIDKYDTANKTGEKKVQWGKDDLAKKTGNVTPSVDGTLVIDLRTKKPEGVAQPTEPGYMYMHEGFYRMTTDNKMLFYGSAVVPENTMHIELTKVGLWNIDGCQLLNVTKDGDNYTKQHFWEIVGGFTVDATDADGNAVNLNVTDGLNSNTETDSKTFVYKHTMNHNNADLATNDNFNNDYEFQYKDQEQLLSTIKLPVMKPGKYNLTVRLLPVDGYQVPANKTFDDICHPLQLTAEIGVPSVKASPDPVAKFVSVKLETPEWATVGVHKGHTERHPVMYNYVNEAQLKVVPEVAEQDPAVTWKYAFAIDGTSVEATKNGDAYVISGMPFDAAAKQLKAATVTVTPTCTFDNVEYQGKPFNIYIKDADATGNFASMFSNVDWNSSQVIITEGRLNGGKQYVYSANPVFAVNKPAGTSELYKVGGFELDKSTLYNVTVNGAEKQYEMDSQFDDLSFYYTDGEGKHNYREPRVCGQQGVIKGQSDYTAYDHTTWDNAKNNWAELIIPETSKSVGMMIPHYYADPTRMTGTSTPLHGNYSVTFYTYYPVRDAAGNLSLVEVQGAKVNVNKDQTGSGVTGVENVTIDADALLDVYTMSGVRVMHNVSREEALQQLQPGVYLIGREKVAVQ